MSRTRVTRYLYLAVGLIFASPAFADIHTNEREAVLHCQELADGLEAQYPGNGWHCVKEVDATYSNIQMYRVSSPTNVKHQAPHQTPLTSPQCVDEPDSTGAVQEQNATTTCRSGCELFLDETQPYVSGQDEGQQSGWTWGTWKASGNICSESTDGLNSSAPDPTQGGGTGGGTGGGDEGGTGGGDTGGGTGGGDTGGGGTTDPTDPTDPNNPDDGNGTTVNVDLSGVEQRLDAINGKLPNFNETQDPNIGPDQYTQADAWDNSASTNPADSLNESGFGWSRSCPSFAPVSIMGYSVQIGNEVFCTVMTIIGALVLMAGYLHAGYIIGRAVT